MRRSGQSARDGDPLPLPELDKALKGIVGTDKAEVDAEAKKEQRRKAKGKKANPQDDG